MQLEQRNLAAEVTRPPNGVGAGVLPRQPMVVPDYAANVRRVGTPWWMQPVDYPFAVAAGTTDQTLLETTNEFWVAITRLTAIAYALDGPNVGEPSSRYPIFVRLRDTSRRYPLVLDWAPLNCVAGVGRSCKGWLPGRGWVMPPNTTIVCEFRNDSSVPLAIFIQALAARVLFEGGDA